MGTVDGGALSFAGAYRNDDAPRGVRGEKNGTKLRGNANSNLDGSIVEGNQYRRRGVGDAAAVAVGSLVW